MESVVPGGEPQPASTITVDDDYDGVFKNLLDIDFITVNRVCDEIHAEVFMSDVDEITNDRIATANAMAAKHGFRSYANKPADLYEDANVVLLRYSDDPAKGLIWALESDMASTWWQ